MKTSVLAVLAVLAVFALSNDKGIPHINRIALKLLIVFLVSTPFMFLFSNVGFGNGVSFFSSILVSFGMYKSVQFYTNSLLNR
tara:strand:- start:2270 stop:2518 length:249 start_codon:yes stop_codon:yes gene_type:complete